MPFIETRDGTRLFYKDWGTGPATVFVHSWALRSDMWDYQMTYLTARGIRCIAYDQRGHGRSDQPGHGYEYDTLADDLEAALDHLDLRDVTLVGHSMGGAEIVRYLSRHGAGRIARFVLIAPMTPFILKTADNPDGVDRSIFDYVRAVQCEDFPRWAADNALTFFVPETSPELVAWGLRMFLQTPLKVAIDCSYAIQETDLRAEMAGITAPSLIIHGDADLTAPIDFTGRRSAHLLPNSRLIVYEGARHGLMFTHIERLNRDLLAFIEG
jgi:pimeloyl-ACP methyl ester carboxylesterase